MFRRTSGTVFDTFPWPQFEMGGTGRLPAPPKDLEKIRAVADAACELRALRRSIMDANGWSLRDLYRTLETPGDNKLRAAHAALDTAVRAAYGLKEKEDILAFVLKLNLDLAAKESKADPITPPGLPAFITMRERFISEDCVRVAEAADNVVSAKKLRRGKSTPQSEADAAHFYSAKEEPLPYAPGNSAHQKADRG